MDGVPIASSLEEDHSLAGDIQPQTKDVTIKERDAKILRETSDYHMRHALLQQDFQPSTPSAGFLFMLDASLLIC